LESAQELMTQELAQIQEAQSARRTADLIRQLG
jgi:hypothetical protein